MREKHHSNNVNREVAGGHIVCYILNIDLFIIL